MSLSIISLGWGKKKKTSKKQSSHQPRGRRGRHRRFLIVQRRLTNGHSPTKTLQGLKSQVRRMGEIPNSFKFKGKGGGEPLNGNVKLRESPGKIEIRRASRSHPPPLFSLKMKRSSGKWDLMGPGNHPRGSAPALEGDSRHRRWKPGPRTASPTRPPTNTALRKIPEWGRPKSPKSSLKKAWEASSPGGGPRRVGRGARPGLHHSTWRGSWAGWGRRCDRGVSLALAPRCNLAAAVAARTVFKFPSLELSSSEHAQ